MDGSSFFASFASASTSPKETIQFNGAIDSFPIKKKDVSQAKGFFAISVS